MVPSLFFQFICIIFLLAAIASSEHQLDNVCARSCSGVSSEVKYDVGRNYLYDVNSQITLKFGHGQEIVVTQNAKAQISVHSPCDFSIMLKRVSLSGMEVGSNWSATLERYPLRFAFDDGKVEAVCSLPADPVWAVNIKKAILSSFQINHDAEREVDIIGDCPVKIEKRRSGAVLSLKSSKNIGECHRSYSHSGVRAIPYRIQSKVQTIPLFDGEHVCERDLSDSNLQRVTCTENYQIDPVSSIGGDNLLALNVRQTMIATGIAHADLYMMEEAYSNHDSIEYKNTDNDQLQMKGSVGHVKQIIDELCKTSDRVDADAASHFSDLVLNLRSLSMQEITSVSVARCDAFAYALAACASQNCISQLGHFVNSGSAPESVFASLALLFTPKEETVDSVATFIDRVPLNGLLPITSLVHSYCLMHPTCGTKASVTTIIDSILRKLPSGCTVGNRIDEVEKAVILLKSLGNIGHEDYSLARLSECIENTRNRIEVTLAAIDALRRKPCSELRNRRITQLFLNKKENVEVRIGSFRQLMECPSDANIDLIISNLQNETINQVGSYVWSYLNSKQWSSDPGSQSLRNILKRYNLPERFNMDPRRFSRFYEAGNFIKDDNYGGHMDASVVFVPDGYIPREVGLNFTISFFGKSINILEIGARVEGLEKAENDLFGADGYVTNPNGYVFRKEEHQFRNPRMNQLRQLLAPHQTDARNDRISAFFYTRMFGDDLHFCAIEKDDIVDEIKQSFDMDKMFMKLAQEQSLKFTRYMLLFEFSHTLPTFAGLPVHMVLNSSLATKIDHNMNMNLVELLRQKGNANGHINSRPSLSISIGASVFLRANQVRTGVLANSNLYSATSAVREMSLKNGQKFSLKIEVPHTDAFVAQFRHNWVKVDSDRHQAIGSVLKRQPREAKSRNYCTSDALAKIIGLRGCIEANIDFPTISGQIKLEKADSSLTSYMINVERATNPGEQKLKLSFDTPGSRVNRKVEADFDLSVARKKLKMMIATPVNKIAIDGDIEEQRQRGDYGAKLKLVLDGRQEYILDGSLKTKTEDSKMKYSLNAKAVTGISGTSSAELSSEIKYSVEKYYLLFDFNLEKVFRQPIIFQTLLDMEAPKYECKLQYSGPEFNGILKSSIVHSRLLDLNGNLIGEYQLANNPKKSLEIGIQQTLQKGAGTHHLEHTAYITSTSMRRFDFHALSLRNGDNVKNLLEATCFGKKSMIKLDVTRDVKRVFKAISEVKCDQLGVDTKATISYQNRFPQQFMLVVDAETAKTKGIHASAQYAMKVDPKWRLEAEARFAYPGREIVATNMIDETQRGRYKVKTLIKWDPREQISADTDVLFQPRTGEYTFETTARVSNLRELITLKHHVLSQDNKRNILWQARQGNVLIYDFKYDIVGNLQKPRQINIAIKSEKFTPKLDYDMMMKIDQSVDEISAHMAVKKNGRHLGESNLVLPIRLADNPVQKYRAEINYIYENRPINAVAELNRRQVPQGTFNSFNIQSDNKFNLSVEANFDDRIHLKCDLERNRVRTIAADFISTPLNAWDNFEIHGHLSTDEPLPRKMLKAKALFNNQPNQADVEARFESGGERYLIEGRWKKAHEADGRHYTYLAKIESPQSKVSFDQQLQVEGPITLRKAQTNLEISAAGKSYKLANEINRDEESLKYATKFSGNRVQLTHNVDYRHRNGERILKKSLKFNEKEVDFGLATIYRDGEVKISAQLASTYDQISNLKTLFGCSKAIGRWNCKFDNNLNNKYILSGHETLSPQKIDIGYLVNISSLIDNEASLLFDVDKRSSKYRANALLRNKRTSYAFDLDVSGRGGTLNLQTPTHSINNARVRVTPRGRDEIEITSERGDRQGKIRALIKNENVDKLLEVQVTEIAEPFKIIIASAFARGAQTLIAELTLDPIGRNKKTYGVKNVLEEEGELFRALRSTISHPKRSILVEILRPTGNKYAISIQPHVGSGRQATVADMTYDRNAHGYHWELSFSDPALAHPITAKIDLKKTGIDEKSYGVDLQTEFDYSGNEADKIFANSFHLERNVLSRTRESSGDVRFVAEFKSTHPASNLYTHLWAKIDRRPVKLDENKQNYQLVQPERLIPVSVSFGLETKNAHGQRVEYSLNVHTDVKKLSEIKLTAVKNSAIIRAEKVADQHYKLKLYKDSDRATFIGDLIIDNSGVELELRDEKLNEVKLHASALMPNDHFSEIKLWHSKRGKKIDDLSVSFEVKEDNLFKGLFYIRPDIESDIKQIKEKVVPSIQAGDSSTLLRDSLVPIFAAHKQIANDVTLRIDKLVKAWAKENHAIATELGPEYAEIVVEIQENYEALQEAVLLAYDQAYQATEQFAKALPQSDIVNNLRQLKNDSSELPKQLIAAMKPITDIFELVSKQLNDLQKGVQITVDDLQKTLKIDQLKDAVNEYKRKLAATDVLREVLIEGGRLSQKLGMTQVEQKLYDIELNRAQYEGKALQFYDKAIDMLLDRFLVSYLSEITDLALEHLSSTPIDDSEIEIILRHLMRYLRGEINGDELSEAFLTRYVPKLKRKAPGAYELTAVIPHGATTLNELLNNLHPNHLIALKSAIVETVGLTEVGKGPIDTIYSYKPLAMGDWRLLSPFDSTSYVVDGDRFITFDGRVMAFHAPCEYLLASDLRSQRFALFAVFSQRGQLDSIKADFIGDEVVIHKKGDVQVNGQSVSLPWQKIDSMDGTSLISLHIEDEWIIMKTYDGISVQCNSKHDICMIVLPRHLHGKSSGLLGVNDNEPYNDNFLVDGKPNEDLNTLAEHWATSGRCNRNNAQQMTKEVNDRCEEYFSSLWSTMHSCFEHIYPASFERMCASNGNKGQCTAASAYFTACDQIDIEIGLPDDCIDCGHETVADEVTTIEQQPTENDIVFVVEERPCLESYKNKLERMAERINRKERDVRFGWVGFGGEGVHNQPLLHFESGNALLNINNFLLQLRQKFAPESGIESKPSAPENAILYAVKHFPFRFASAKTIVLAMCRSCSGTEQSDLLNSLLEQGIMLHVLSLSKLRTSDQIKAVGLNAVQLFDERGAEIGHRSTLLKPSDGCAVVAQQTNGTVFNIKHGLMAFTAKALKNDAKSCLNCRCEADKLFARNVCRPCNPLQPTQLLSFGSTDPDDDIEL